LQIEEPVRCWDCTSFDFHATLASVFGATLIGDQVIQMGQPSQKRLLAPGWMVKPFHREYLPLDGVVGLVEQGVGHGHLRVCEHRIPARLLLLEPTPNALAVGRPSRVGDVVRKVAEPLTQGKHAQALPLARPVPQGVELGA